MKRAIVSSYHRTLGIPLQPVAEMDIHSPSPDHYIPHYSCYPASSSLISSEVPSRPLPYLLTSTCTFFRIRCSITHPLCFLRLPRCRPYVPHGFSVTFDGLNFRGFSYLAKRWKQKIFHGRGQSKRNEPSASLKKRATSTRTSGNVRTQQRAGTRPRWFVRHAPW